MQDGSGRMGKQKKARENGQAVRVSRNEQAGIVRGNG